MGKSKKLSDKLRLYYRGQIRRPTLVAEEHHVSIIKDALKECLPNRVEAAFVSNWINIRETVRFKLAVGLKSTLRYLKQKRAKAIVFEESVNEHLIKYLIEYSNKIKIPSIQVRNLHNLVGPESDLKNLLVFSLIEADRIDDSIYQAGYPKPKNLIKTIDSKAFRNFVRLIIEQSETLSDTQTKVIYKEPVLDRVKSSGSSKAKKADKKSLKALRQVTKIEQPNVSKISNPN